MCKKHSGVLATAALKKRHIDLLNNSTSVLIHKDSSRGAIDSREQPGSPIYGLSALSREAGMFSSTLCFS